MRISNYPSPVPTTSIRLSKTSQHRIRQIRQNLAPSYLGAWKAPRHLFHTERQKVKLLMSHLFNTIGWRDGVRAAFVAFITRTIKGAFLAALGGPFHFVGSPCVEALLLRTVPKLFQQNGCMCCQPSCAPGQSFQRMETFGRHEVERTNTHIRTLSATLSVVRTLFVLRSR